MFLRGPAAFCRLQACPQRLRLRGSEFVAHMLTLTSPGLVLDGALQPVSQATKQVLLLVDDEEGPRQSIRIVFKDEYRILMADNGPMAIKLAKEYAIDAAVLDIRMAGMSGIEVLNALKAIDPSTEVVMLTA